MNRKLIFKSKEKSTSFSICSYNILAQGLHDKNKNKKSKNLEKIESWPNRWKMLKQEFIKLNSDIYCLVEVENNVYNNELKTFFYLNNNKNFNGVYTPREYYTSETKPMNQIVGNAIFYNTDRFRIIQTRTLDYKKEATLFFKKQNQNLTKNIKKIKLGIWWNLYNFRRFENFQKIINLL